MKANAGLLIAALSLGLILGYLVGQRRQPAPAPGKTAEPESSALTADLIGRWRLWLVGSESDIFHLSQGQKKQDLGPVDIEFRDRGEAVYRWRNVASEMRTLAGTYRFLDSENLLIEGQQTKDGPATRWVVLKVSLAKEFDPHRLTLKPPFGPASVYQRRQKQATPPER